MNMHTRRKAERTRIRGELDALKAHERGEQAQREERVAHALTYFAAVASRNFGGLPLTRESMSNFELDKLPIPRDHTPGYVRGARFVDGLLLRISTANADTPLLHTLTYSGVNRDYATPQYTRQSLDRTEVTQLVAFDSLHDIAQVPGVEMDFGGMRAVVEIESYNQWPHAIPYTDLKPLHK